MTVPPVGRPAASKVKPVPEKVTLPAGNAAVVTVIAVAPPAPEAAPARE